MKIVILDKTPIKSKLELISFNDGYKTTLLTRGWA